MKARAKENRDRDAGELEKVTVRLERFDEIEARLTEEQLELKVATKRRKRLTAAGKKLAKLEKAAATSRATLEVVTTRLRGLEESSGALPDESATWQALDDAATALQRRSDLAASLDDQQQRLRRADEALTEANERGEADLIERATRFLAAADPQLQAVVEADRRISAFVKRLEGAAAEVESAQRNLERAGEGRDTSLGRSAEAARILEEAEAALDRGRHVDMAATLRAGLEVDEDCPVCAQLVHEVPAVGTAAHLPELEAVVAEARVTKKEVDEAHTGALGSLERVKEQLASAKDTNHAAKKNSWWALARMPSGSGVISRKPHSSWRRSWDLVIPPRI